MKIFLLLSASLTLFIVLISSYLKLPVYGNDPSSHIVQSTFHFCKANTFISTQDLVNHEEFRKHSEDYPGVYWQDRYVLTIQNQLLPQHAALARILLSPFVCTLGEDGVRVAMGFCLLGIFFGAWLIHSALSSDKASPILLLLSIALGTHILLTGAGMNYDHFYSAVLLLGLGFSLYGKSLIGGSFLGLTMLIRPNALAFYPFVFLVLLLKKRSRLYIFEWCIGVGSFVLLLLILQWYLFGSPFSTFYHAMPMYDHGSVKLNVEPASMSLSVLIQDWLEKLFDYRVGILLWNPALLVSLVLTPFIWRRINKCEWVLISGILLQVGIVFSRNAWAMSFVGNRYLQGFVVIFIAIIASVLTREKWEWSAPKV